MEGNHTYYSKENGVYRRVSPNPHPLTENMEVFDKTPKRFSYEQELKVSSPYSLRVAEILRRDRLSLLDEHHDFLKDMISDTENVVKNLPKDDGNKERMWHLNKYLKMILNDSSKEFPISFAQISRTGDKKFLAYNEVDLLFQTYIDEITESIFQKKVENVILPLKAEINRDDGGIIEIQYLVFINGEGTDEKDGILLSIRYDAGNDDYHLHKKIYNEGWRHTAYLDERTMRFFGGR